MQKVAGQTPQTDQRLRTIDPGQVSVEIIEGKTKAGKDFKSLRMDTPYGSLEGLRGDKWEILEDLFHAMAPENAVSLKLKAALRELHVMRGGATAKTTVLKRF